MAPINSTNRTKVINSNSAVGGKDQFTDGPLSRPLREEQKSADVVSKQPNHPYIAQESGSSNQAVKIAGMNVQMKSSIKVADAVDGSLPTTSYNGEENQPNSQGDLGSTTRVQSKLRRKHESTMSVTSRMRKVPSIFTR